jgi:hypothetical protein
MTAELAYLTGVLQGDGFCSQSLGLRVKDRDFAEAFAAAVTAAFGVSAKLHLEDGRYWKVRSGNGTGRYNFLRTYEPSEIEYGDWLRGYFDSEGNAQLLRLPRVSENAYHRRVAFYSTNQTTLCQAQGYLTALGITASIARQTLSRGHYGSRPVFELKLSCGRANFARFAEVVGTSIERKRIALAAIVGTYRPDVAAHCRAAQLKGAAAKNRKREEVMVPQVLQSIRDLVARGVKPTMANCATIPHYQSIRGTYYRHSDLVRMASGQS